MPDKLFIVFLLFLSVAFFVAGFVPVIVFRVRRKKFYDKKIDGYFERKFSFTAYFLFVILGVFFSVIVSRYAVAYYSSFTEMYVPCKDIGKLGFGFKELVNSFIHALQTFSMDEDYTEYWQNGQDMINYVSGKVPIVRIAYNFCTGALNVIAPLLGGAIIFEVLAQIFPSLRLFWSNMKIVKKITKREKYYFSELNENSIALARSIVSDSSRRKSVLIFTDAYSDDEEEESTEWLLEAKSMGAICIKSDILHIAFDTNNPEGVHVFLIDKEENSNIGTLSKMLDDKNIEKYQNAHIYVFSADRKCSCIEEEVSRIVDLEKARLEKLNKDRKEKINIPYIVPINIVRNMADTLMQELPLFEPLIGTENKELTVTVVGGGSIGTEMFLAAYRFGQILNVKLNMNVVSREAKLSNGNDSNGFDNKINFINPEILESAEKGNDILRYNCNKSAPMYNEPYMDYEYFQSDVMSDKFVSLLESNDRLKNTDYFIIAIGNDEDNFIVADKVRRVVGKHHLMERPDGNAKKVPIKRTVIAYSIYNSKLAGKLNEIKGRKYADNGMKDNDVFMYAFGGKEEVYSCENVFFEGIKYSAYLTGKNYDDHRMLAPEQARILDEKVLIKHHKKMLKDIYNYMSSLARIMHIKYKIFSSGEYRLKDGTYMSVFHEDYDSSKKDEYSRQRLERYKEKIMNISLDGDNYKKNVPVLHRLAWLEHRRWCAFMRTCGFRSVSPDEMMKFYRLSSFEHGEGEQKFIALKLHPCLVECSDNGIFIKLDSSGKAKDGYSDGFDDKMLKSYKDKKFEAFDLLDYLSYYIRCLKKEEDYCYDFKKWDYPSEEEIDEEMYE